MIPWTAACQVSLSITNSRSLLKLMSIESVMPSNHLILCCPLLLLLSIFPSIRIFSNESALYIRWPKYWSFSFNISPSNEFSGSIAFRIDWFDPPCSPRDSQESSLNHSSKASILQCSAFFMVQVSHLYMTTGKTIALTIWTFASQRIEEKNPLHSEDLRDRTQKDLPVAVEQKLSVEWSYSNPDYQCFKARQENRIVSRYLNF